MTDVNNVFADKGRFKRGSALASLALAAMTAGYSQAFAAVICSDAAIAIPATSTEFMSIS